MVLRIKTEFKIREYLKSTNDFIEKYAKADIIYSIICYLSRKYFNEDYSIENVFNFRDFSVKPSRFKTISFILLPNRLSKLIGVDVGVYFNYEVVKSTNSIFISSLKRNGINVLNITTYPVYRVSINLNKNNMKEVVISIKKINEDLLWLYIFSFLGVEIDFIRRKMIIHQYTYNTNYRMAIVGFSDISSIGVISTGNSKNKSISLVIGLKDGSVIPVSCDKYRLGEDVCKGIANILFDYTSTK